MTIAEKLTTIAENQQKVYDAGYAAGQADGSVDLSVPVTMYRCANLNLFGAKEVVFNFDNLLSLAFFMHISNAASYVENTVVEHITWNCAKPITSLQQSLYYNDTRGDNTLKRLTINADTSQATFSNMAAYLYALEVIDGTPLDFTSAGNAGRFLVKVNNLREIRFVAGSIKGNISFVDTAVLSAESIQSIIDGLADLTGSDIKTLTLHADIVLTDEQKATIAAKNWTLVQ